jgi:hypothetical protein
MSINTETKQMLEAIKLLKDSNVTESQIYITLKAKYSGNNLKSIQDCVRALKANQAYRVNTVSAKVDDMMKQMNISPTHKLLIQKLREQPELLDNEISFVDFYSFYLQQLKLSKDEATADTFLIAETFLSNNISNEFFNKKNDVVTVLHEKTKDDEPPLKCQRSSTSTSTESLQDDLDLFNWLSNMF